MGGVQATRRLVSRSSPAWRRPHPPLFPVPSTRTNCRWCPPSLSFRPASGRPLASRPCPRAAGLPVLSWVAAAPSTPCLGSGLTLAPAPTCPPLRTFLQCAVGCDRLAPWLALADALWRARCGWRLGVRVALAHVLFLPTCCCCHGAIVVRSFAKAATKRGVQKPNARRATTSKGTRRRKPAGKVGAPIRVEEGFSSLKQWMAYVQTCRLGSELLEHTQRHTVS